MALHSVAVTGPNMDAAFRGFIPSFGAAGNPVEIIGGAPTTDTSKGHTGGRTPRG
jgi:hypothetical protein